MTTKSNPFVTVERSGARSVDLVQLLNSPRARVQLEQIGVIQAKSAARVRRTGEIPTDPYP